MNLTDILIDVLLFFFIVVCLLMCLVILMQRSKQEGLGAAFGGGFTDQVWGAQTSQVLVKTTVVLAACFFLISISLARLYSHKASVSGAQDSTIDQQLLKPVAPLVTPPTSTNAVVAPATPSVAPAPVVAPATSTTNAPATTTPAKPDAK